MTLLTLKILTFLRCIIRSDMYIAFMSNDNYINLIKITSIIHENIWST